MPESLFGKAVRQTKFAKWQLENAVQLWLYRKGWWQSILRQRLRKAIQTPDAPLRVIIGGGPHLAQRGWFSTERDLLDATSRDSWQHLFHDRRVDHLIAEHVWEHLHWDDGLTAARNAYHWLKPHGSIRIAVPDGLHPHPDYIADWRPGGRGHAAGDHKVLFTYKTLTDMFQAAGFAVTPLEYWDEAGAFHHAPWSEEQGAIRRRPPFSPGEPAWSKGADYATVELCVPISPWDQPRSYRLTSLIVDAHKR